jgi:hypothetical protein
MSFGPSGNRKERPPRRRLAALIVALCLTATGATLADPLPWREYIAAEYGYGELDLPTDFRDPAEWTFGRLMFPSLGWGSQWKAGGTDWTIDYPRADRHIAEMIRRLTVLDARSVEQPVDPEEGDDIFYWPWLYAVEVGTWDLSDDQAATLREYLLRGGFLMVDDFHGSIEWTQFVEGMSRVFPDRPIVDIAEDDPIFHTFWDLEEREQIPGAQFLFYGRTWEEDGRVPYWRGIYDDEGRIMVAICFNMDLGDAVEHSDTPQYPQRYSAIAMRTFINYVLYSMTH